MIRLSKLTECLKTDDMYDLIDSDRRMYMLLGVDESECQIENDIDKQYDSIKGCVLVYEDDIITLIEKERNSELMIPFTVGRIILESDKEQLEVRAVYSCYISVMLSVVEQYSIERFVLNVNGAKSVYICLTGLLKNVNNLIVNSDNYCIVSIGVNAIWCKSEFYLSEKVLLHVIWQKNVMFGDLFTDDSCKTLSRLSGKKIKRDYFIEYGVDVTINKRGAMEFKASVICSSDCVNIQLSVEIDLASKRGLNIFKELREFNIKFLRHMREESGIQ